MNNDLMLQNVPKIEDTKAIYTHMSIKSHHHKLKVKKAYCQTPQELKIVSQQDI